MLKHATNILQGSEYPTASLVLPTLDALIRHMNPQYKLETRQRKAQQFSAAMRVAREKLFKDAVPTLSAYGVAQAGGLCYCDDA